MVRVLLAVILPGAVLALKEPHGFPGRLFIIFAPRGDRNDRLELHRFDLLDGRTGDEGRHSPER